MDACAVRGAATAAALYPLSGIWRVLVFLCTPATYLVTALWSLLTLLATRAWFPLSFVLVPLWHYAILPALVLLGALLAAYLALTLYSQIAASSKPPVAMFVVAVNILLYVASHLAVWAAARARPPLQLGTLARLGTALQLPLRDWWFHTNSVLAGEYGRLLASTFLHLNLFHVLGNMVVFLPMALLLEAQLGSLVFAGVIAVLAVVPNMLYVVAAVGMRRLLCVVSFMDTCVVGFSGVVFGLQALLSCQGATSHGAVYSSIATFYEKQFQSNGESANTSHLTHAVRCAGRLCGAAVCVIRSSPLPNAQCADSCHSSVPRRSVAAPLALLSELPCARSRTTRGRGAQWRRRWQPTRIAPPCDLQSRTQLWSP